MDEREPGYVDGGYLSLVAESDGHSRRRILEVLVRPGQRVLDVGCGPGTDTPVIAQMVGAEGLVVGIDVDGAMIDRANDRVASQSFAAWVEHRQADTRALPFSDGAFDLVRAERVLMHVPEHEVAIKEMARVLKPGGTLSLADPDWSTLSFDTDLVNIERAFVRHLSERFFRNGMAGRRHFAECARQGMVQVSVSGTVFSLTNYRFARVLFLLPEVEDHAIRRGELLRDDVLRLRTDLARRDRQGLFFCSVHGLRVVAHKP